LVLSTKRLIAAAKSLVAATKNLFVVPYFVTATKPFFPCSDAVRKQKNLFLRIFLVQYCKKIEIYPPSENPKFNNLGIFQSLKLGNSMQEIFRISL